MRVGNPMLRRNDYNPTSVASKATSFRCFTGTYPGDGVPSYGPDDSFEFPNRPCTGGIRSNIYFPQCWDGVNLDSPDHEVCSPLIITTSALKALSFVQSHVSHPIGGFFRVDCPASHPVRLPILFMEIVWDTRAFNDPALWPKDGSQPFVFSMGDP